MVVRRAMKFSTIVAGGGAIEMEISRFYIPPKKPKINPNFLLISQIPFIP